MAKKYTQAQWARLQSSLPEEDRVPYSESPDAAPTALQQLQESTKTDVDPYYVRDPKTGLSPAQVDAQKAVEEAQAANQALGIPSRIVNKPGSAGSISTPPDTGLKAGYEWYAFNLPGGGFEWRQKPTRETLAKAYNTMFSGNNNKGSSGGSAGGSASGDGGAAAALAAQQAAQAAAELKRQQGQSAYDLLFEQFNNYGLGGLVEPLRQFIVDGLSPAEFTIRLRDTDAYKKRFAANQARIQKGLRALTEAEYIGLEDQYQDVMRRYGLPENYYTRGDMGRQEGFEKFIGGDVSPVELEDRIQTAQRRVINAAPEVTASLRQFYPELGQGDLLAYFLDPDKAIENIKRKVTAAEIGGAATMAGLATGVQRAEELARFGITGEQARQGFQTVAEVAPRGSQLAEIYKQSPYTQTTAEQEVFGLTGATEAAARRRRLTQLEQASFAGSSGMSGGALGRERAGAI
jgi:hypothetical protein